MLSGPQRKFCEGIVSGLNQTKAYQAAYPKATVKSAAEAGAVLSRKIKIKEEIARLTAAVEKVIVKKFAWQELDWLNWNLRVIQTPIGEVHKGHDLCQEYAETTTADGGSQRWKMPAKMDAADKIAKNRGWYSPDKVEHSGEVKMSFMERMANIRSHKKQ